MIPRTDIAILGACFPQAKTGGGSFLDADYIRTSVTDSNRWKDSEYTSFYLYRDFRLGIGIDSCCGPDGTLVQEIRK